MNGTRQELELLLSQLTELQDIQSRKDLLSYIIATSDPLKPYAVNWHHRYLATKLNQFVNGEIQYLIVEMPPRHGKQVSDLTKILTTNGWKTHGELKINDYVFHPSGKPIRVKWISKKTPSKVQVTFTNGEVINCHENHEWNVYDRAFSKSRTVETKYFLNQKINSGKRSRFQLEHIEPVRFEEKIHLMPAYVLGAWLGDGTSSAARISYTPNDRSYIDKIISLGYQVSSEYVHKVTGVKTINFGGVAFNSGRMTKELQSISVFKNKHIPDSYKFSSIDQRLELLAGLIDTDGHVENKTGRVRVVTVSKKLAEDIKEVAMSLGFKPYITIQEPKLSTSGIQGKKVVYTVGFQPTLKIPCVLDRKQIKEFSVRRKIGISSVIITDSSELGHCIEVDSEDGLYLIGETLIPTHNSEQVSRALPAFIHGRFPDDEIFAVSYLDSLATEMCTAVQERMETEAHIRVFPDAKIHKQGVKYTTGTRNSSEHDIVGRKGVYRAAGVGGSFTGKGANWIIIDDPIKGREIADSEAFRERLWNFWKNDLFTRLETNLQTGRKGQVLITMTRWHEDDLVGRLMEQMKNDPEAIQWEVVSFPAIKENNTNPDDPRTIGEALWGVKYNLKQLASIRAAVGTRAWGSLYQQHPTPDGGALFSENMFAYADIPPMDSFDYFFCTADTAYKDKEENDFHDFAFWGVIENELWLIDNQMKQIKAKDVESWMLPHLRSWQSHDTFRQVWIEPKGHGIYLNQKLPELNINIPSEDDINEFYKDRRFDKVARANNQAPHLAHRVLKINNQIHNKEQLVLQALNFPKGKNDDFVDTMVDALKVTYGRSRSILDSFMQ